MVFTPCMSQMAPVTVCDFYQYPEGVPYCMGELDALQIF